MEPILPPAPEPTTETGPLPVKRGHSHTPARSGHVTSGWTTVFWIGWLLVAGGFGAIWYSSRTTGLSTWWLGPQSAPHLAFSILPFLAPFVLAFLAIRLTRQLPWYGIAGAVATALIALGDLSDEPKYAAVEFALAGAGLAVSAACFAGMLRPAPPLEGEAEG